jgi:hypothetical protein
MTEVAQVALGGGNTNSPPVVEEMKKKRVSGALRWIFVWNNYPSDWLAQMAQTLEGSEWGATFEIGESGTPHIQGYCEFPTKVRPIGYRGCPKEVHWGDKKGKPCKMDRLNNLRYICKKTSIWVPESTLNPVKPKREIKIWPCDLDWQKGILEIIKEDPDERTLHWYWSDKGGTRKTSMCKYLVMKHEALILGGKAADCRHGIAAYYEKNGECPELVVINIPRSFGAEYVSYEAFENIKDMLFFSGKYEGCSIIGNCPHVIVFANFEPNEEKMSENRWKVNNVDTDNLVNEKKRPASCLDFSDTL